MSVTWGGYKHLDADDIQNRQAISPREARALFNRTMATKSERISGLLLLLRESNVAYDSTDEGIQAINDWFYHNVEGDPESPGNMTPNWFSVANDIGLFLGDAMIDRHPGLRWEFFIWGKKNHVYQKHVIVGMGKEDPKYHTNIDICGGVETYGNRLIMQRGSIRSVGDVTVRGVQIDVDESLAIARQQPIETDAFVGWMKNVATRV